MGADKITVLPPRGVNDERLATAPVLARWLGISGKSVYDLAKAGVLVRSSRDQFLLEESVRRYCDHIRSIAPSLEPVGGAETFESNGNDSA